MMMNGIAKICKEIKKLGINALYFIGNKLTIILNIIFTIIIFTVKDDNGFIFCFFFIFEFAKWCKNVIVLEKEKDKFRNVKLKERFTKRDHDGNVTVKKSNMEKAILYLCSIEDYIYNE